MAVAAAGAIAVTASASAAALLMRWLADIVCCLLVLAGRPVRPDRREPSARAAKERQRTVRDR